MRPLAAAEFDALMRPLGPFERRPTLAVAVSGGADSLALCLLADAWARARGGRVQGLIVDHGLRPGSGPEAALTRERLAARGIGATILPLDGLVRGPGLAARARAARYAALAAACAAEGILHLLLGHHAGDQAETVAMRRLAGSGPDGLAAMLALLETREVRLLRPLLTLPPGRLRATLRAIGEDWVDDPSNADPAAQRARLRALRGDREGSGPATRAAVVAAAARGDSRAWRERATAACLARRARIAPEGFAVVSPGALPTGALAALLRTLAGRVWPPAPARVAALAGRPHPATLGGVRLLPAGRLNPGGWLLVRELAAISPVSQAPTIAGWDGRFRLGWAGALPPAGEIAPLAADAARFRGASDVPYAARQGLPCLRVRGKLAAAPRDLYADETGAATLTAVFAPVVALASAPFAAPRAGGTSACGPGEGIAPPG